VPTGQLEAMIAFGCLIVFAFLCGSALNFGSSSIEEAFGAEAEGW
jgi:hypothetical protein